MVVLQKRVGQLIRRALSLLLAVVLQVPLSQIPLFGRADSFGSWALAEENPLAFRLLDTEKSLVTEASLLGKLTLVSFFFSRCEGPCPSMNAKLNLLAQRTKALRGFQIYSISIDGMHDTPEVLKTYSEKFSPSANWRFLTSDPDAVQKLSEQVFHFAADSQEKVHTTRFILLGKKGEVLKTVDSTDQGSLSAIEDIVKASL